MIISDNVTQDNSKFEELLRNTYSNLSNEASVQSDYFSQRTPTEFEVDVCTAMEEEAEGTEFQNTITLISGNSFPDIKIDDYYGVEVKTSSGNSTRWTTLGNSVLESTRVQNVERIYIFYGKLKKPAEFKYRLYQECLSGISVTHYPRYKIDMELPEGETIFDKMNVAYDTLRRDNPIRHVRDYYKTLGEELWWMGDTEESATVQPTVRLWNKLASDERETILCQAFARFPEILGDNRNTKYERCALWLVARHGIAHPSLRDDFSAGGVRPIVVGQNTYTGLPKVFHNFTSRIEPTIEMVKSLPTNDAQYYLDLPSSSTSEQKIYRWTRLVLEESEATLKEKHHFMVHLLSSFLSDEEISSELRQLISRYQLSDESS